MLIPRNLSKSALALTLALSPVAMAQTTNGDQIPKIDAIETVAAPVVDAQNNPATPAPVASPAPAPAQPQWKQYFESASGLIRFRGQQNASGVTTREQAQYIVDVKLRYDLLPDGKLAIRGRIETGNNFKNNANDLAGTYPATGASKVIAAKQLFVDYKPIKDLNLQGGFMPSKTPGEAAAGSIFSLDADGWVDGGRVIKNNLRPWASELAVTVGHLGNFNDVNFYKRAGDMSHVNFVEVHVRGDLTKFLSMSNAVARYEGNTYITNSETVKMDAINVLKENLPNFVQIVNKVILDDYFQGTKYQGFGITVKTAAIRDYSAWLTFSNRATGSTKLSTANLPQEDFYMDGNQISIGGEKKLTNLSKHVTVVPFFRAGFTVSGGKKTGASPTGKRVEAGVRFDLKK